MSATLNLSPDELLTTTRAVRRRLDFDRPVELDVVRECVRIALQAPSGSNRQGWHWVVVTDADQRARIAELYLSAFVEYRDAATQPGGVLAAEGERAAVQQRVSTSIEYLAQNMHRVPVLLIACVRAPDSAVLTDAAQATMWGSLFPAVWSYMLAARARGLGTAWTDLHLRYETEIAEILGLPAGIRQGPLIPTAYTLGTEFKAAPRASLDDVLHIDRW
jgi:nitroreductase